MFEQLRSAHIRTLEAMGQLKRENAELQKRVTELERSAKPGSDRMKPEELDSLYVEERRIIESLERENKELKTAVLGARATRDADVAAAQAEVRRISVGYEEAREAARRAAQLAAEQISQIRAAYKSELDAKAAECEAERAKAHELDIECGVEKSRGDALERALAEARQRPPPPPEPDPEGGTLKQQLASAILRAQLADEASEKANEKANKAEADKSVALKNLRSANVAMEAADFVVAKSDAESEAWE